MKFQLKFIFRYISFWYLVFFLQRNIFLFYFKNNHPFAFNEWVLCNLHSFFSDISAISYILLPVILLTIVLFVNNKFNFAKYCRIYTIVILIISNFILISDLGLFAEWGSKINHKAISYLIYPKEALASAKTSPVFLLMFIFLIKTAAEIILLKTIIKKILDIHINWAIKSGFAILLLFFVFVGIRGGLQTFPIDRSWSYFSDKTLLNQAAVNSTWNAMAAITEKDEFEVNPYNFVPNSEAEAIFSNLTSVGKTKSSNSIFKTAKPNIIIIMLESWGAETVGVLNKETDATPYFSALTKEGLLFTQFYSTGFRTEQALAAIVAGFPSQPKTTIIRKFGKFDKMPSLAKSLAAINYHTSYYYGGDLKFANTEAYLKSSGFKKIIGQNDFKYKLYNEWGAFDEDLFAFTSLDYNNNPQPFFSIIMTSTSHEPFDNRVEKVFKDMGLAGDYLNVVHYTDKALHHFIDSSKKEKWFQNAVFIMVADHTNRLPKNRQNFEIERHWIPCLIYGPALKDEFRGKTVNHAASHIDIPAIVLSQLNHDYKQFIWSKNVIDSLSKSWAFYTYDEGFGYINNNDKIVFDIKLNRLIYNNQTDKLKTDSLTLDGKVLLQKLLDQYMSYSN